VLTNPSLKNQNPLVIVKNKKRRRKTRKEEFDFDDFSESDGGGLTLII